MENKDLHKKLTALMNGLTDEQKEKAKACKTLNELMAFAVKEGIELPDEALEGVSSGASYRYNQFTHMYEVTNDEGTQVYEKFRDEEGARVNVDFYTFLENNGYFG